MALFSLTIFYLKVFSNAMVNFDLNKDSVHILPAANSLAPSANSIGNVMVR